MLPTAENRNAAQTVATPAGSATAGLVTMERPTGAATRAAEDRKTRRRRMASSLWRTASPPLVRESQPAAARFTRAVARPPMSLNTRTQYLPKRPFIDPDNRPSRLKERIRQSRPPQPKNAKSPVLGHPQRSLNFVVNSR